MESTPIEEDKQQAEGQSQPQKFNPVAEIAEELDKLKIDWRAPDFDKTIAEAKF